MIWTLNDSGNEPWIFAVDSAGRTLGIFRVTGAHNFDWESLTLSPCPAGSCLVIGDTGDNPERRPSVTLYRIPEPTVNQATAEVLTATAPADTFGLRYPDGPHDVEAMYADSIGTLYFVSKGRSKGIWLFRLSAGRVGERIGRRAGAPRFPADRAGARHRPVGHRRGPLARRHPCGGPDLFGRLLLHGRR